MGTTNYTAINAKAVSVNGTPIAGSGATSGTLTKFDDLAASAIAINGSVVQGSLPAGAIYTNFDSVDVSSLNGGSGGGVTNNVLVANRFQMATSTANISGSLPYTSRRGHWASPMGAVSNFVCVDHGYYISGTYALAAAATYTIKRYIEYPQGVFTPVTWGGSPTVVIPLGSAIVVSDPVALTIPAGVKFWERTVVTSATTVPTIELPDTPVNLGIDDGNATGDFGNSGTIPAGSTNATSIGCMAMVGTVAASNARGFLISGDSIPFGQNDLVSAGLRGGSGYIARGLDGKYPWVKITKGGSAAFNFAGDTTPSKAFYTALSAALGITDMICEFGGGDLRQAGQTPTTIAASLQSVYTMFASGKRIYQTTILPRSDSTDAWVTTANQTPKTDGNWAQLSTLNANIRSIQAQVTGVIEAADIAMTARDSGIWNAPPARTDDGVHPLTAMASLISAAVLPAVSGATPTMANFQAAIAAVKANQRRMVIAGVGDSTTAGAGAAIDVGTGAGTQATSVDFSKASAYTHKLIADFTAAGIPVRADAFFGNGNFGASALGTTGTNVGLTFGTGWSASGNTLGGKGFQATTAATTMTFTPEKAADTFRVRLLCANGRGTATVSSASGALTITDTAGNASDLNCQNATAIERTVVITRPVATLDPLVFTTSSATVWSPLSIDPYNSTLAEVCILNMGGSGWLTADWISSTTDYSPLSAIVKMTYVDLWEVDIGLNDFSGSIAASTFQSNLRVLLNNCQRSGAMTLVEKPNSATSGDLDSTYLAAIDAAAALAQIPAPINVHDELTLVTTDRYDRIHLSGQGNAKRATYTFGKWKALGGF